MSARRRLDFGQSTKSEVVVADPVDWDSFLLENRSSRSRRCAIIARAVRAIGVSGLEARGHCSLSELQRVLCGALGKEEADRALGQLRMHEDWIRITGAEVAFPGLASAATVVDTLN